MDHEIIAHLLDTLLAVEWQIPDETNHFTWSNQLGTWATVLAMMAGAWWALKAWTAKKPERVRQPWVSSHLRFLRRFHLWLGFLAFGLATIHGLTHLYADWGNIRLLSGVIVFLVFLLLAGFGWRCHQKRTRQAVGLHRWLAVVFLVLLFIHGGGSMVFALLLFSLYGLGLKMSMGKGLGVISK